MLATITRENEVLCLAICSACLNEESATWFQVSFFNIHLVIILEVYGWNGSITYISTFLLFQRSSQVVAVIKRHVRVGNKVPSHSHPNRVCVFVFGNSYTILLASAYYTFLTVGCPCVGKVHRHTDDREGSSAWTFGGKCITLTRF